nr:hypothetical protein CVNMHQAP_CVNMHQAP_CDS_0148 [uncultured phage]
MPSSSCSQEICLLRFSIILRKSFIINLFIFSNSISHFLR